MTDVHYEVLARPNPYSAASEKPCMVVRVFDTENAALAYVNSLEFSHFDSVRDPYEHVRAVYEP